MRRRTIRKAKILITEASMVYAAIQMGIVLHEDRKVHASCIEEESHSLVASRDWGEEDSEILLRIAMAEAEGEDTEGKALVMLTVLNRVWSDDFPDSISEVVFEEGQFIPVEDGGRYWSLEPNKECYEALKMVQIDAWDESHGALYFCRPCSGEWMDQNCEYLFSHGNHDFYK